MDVSYIFLWIVDTTPLHTPTEFYQDKVKTWKWAVVLTEGHECTRTLPKTEPTDDNDFNKGFKERAEQILPRMVILLFLSVSMHVFIKKSKK